MAVARASDLRSVVSQQRVVRVPGTELDIIMRRVDLQSLLIEGRLTLDQVTRVFNLVTSWQRSEGGALDYAAVGKSVIEHGTLVADVVDALLCASAIQPRLVRTPTTDADELCVDEIPIMVRLALLQEAVAAPTTVAPAAVTH